MAISFCDEFNISTENFSKTNALNIILDMDTQYFIDPQLVNSCKIPEFQRAETKISDFFAGIKSLILASKYKNDVFWKKASKMLTFKEYSNTCLGYSDNGTNGKRSAWRKLCRASLPCGKTDSGA